MRHYNSVFHQLLKHIPWEEFDALVKQHRADVRARRLTTESQFLAMLYGQLSGAASLREIVGGIESHRARLYHLGAKLPRRATLADAGRILRRAAELMIGRAHRGLRRSLAETTYLIDATGLRLDARSLDWARFSQGVCGAKLHVVYDPDADRPIFAAITPARVNSLPTGLMGWMAPSRHLCARVGLSTTPTDGSHPRSRLQRLGWIWPKRCFRCMELMHWGQWRCVARCAGGRFWRSLPSCRPAWSGWRRARRRITGPGRSPSWAMTCG